MAQRRLRYSERKRLAESGSLGDLSHDEVPDPLRNAVRNLYRNSTKVTRKFERHFTNVSVEYFGLAGPSYALGMIESGDVQEFLDSLEIMLEASQQEPGYLTDFQDRLNDLCDRHRFGFRFESGEAQRVGSPALTDFILGPALLASQREGWDEVERSYREAIHHQRGGQDERDDALTAANAAVEAALKAAGYHGANLGPLAADFKRRSPVSQLAGVPEALDQLLKRSGAIRHEHGDAHGKESGAAEVPQALVDLAIYWAGAFIVFLAEIS
jgi:hypothetical protein